MKKHICILLIFTMIFTLFSSTSVSAVTSGSCGENTSYTLTDDGELIISGTGTVGRITQDNSIKQRTKKITIEPGVTGIFEQAFNEFSNADRIVIPDTITSIGMCAFEDTAYYKDKNNWTDEVLYIDKHLIKADTNIADGYEIKPDTICIADSAFQACTSLNRVVIPDSVTNIGKWAFCGSVVKDIIIPNSVTVIDRAAFLSCDKLESITIPDSVERIEYAAFVNCTI